MDVVASISDSNGSHSSTRATLPLNEAPSQCNSCQRGIGVLAVIITLNMMTMLTMSTVLTMLSMLGTITTETLHARLSRARAQLGKQPHAQTLRNLQVLYCST